MTEPLNTDNADQDKTAVLTVLDDAHTNGLAQKLVDDVSDNVAGPVLPSVSSTITTDAAPDPHHKTNGSIYDPDAQQMVIVSLRSQIKDLVSQVTQLNNKLVKSYDRVSDLEDELHVSSANLRTSSLKVSELELERSQHLSALNTGMLVEKSHVTTELNRLMEKATEEAAQRGQAESARVAIEKELDDLSANLFNQANTMVAEARYTQHVSEKKMEAAEVALKGAEEAVSVMQQQMQALREEKENAEKRAQEMQISMGKGNWVEQRDGKSITRSLRLLSSHTPYQEFMLFVAHLRSIHPSTTQPPAMSTLLTLPFLQRLLTEDSEPTTRLDLAPSLNWLSRRSVLAAIHNGQLVIEPLSVGAFLTEAAAHGNDDLPCALCGGLVFPGPDSTKNQLKRPPVHPLGLSRSSAGSNSWSTSLFKKSTNATTSSQPSSPQKRSRSSDVPQVFIFRVQSASAPLPSLAIPTSSASHPPSHSHNHSNSQSSTIYPLCFSGWCLSRLRTTCTLWAFVRTGIVEKIWEEEIPSLPPPPAVTNSVTSTPAKPSAPPPRKRGLWGMASALGEKAANWGEAAKKVAPNIQQSTPQQQQDSQEPPASQKASTEKSDGAKKLPPPPPTHPVVAAAHGSAPAAAAAPPLPTRAARHQAPLASKADAPSAPEQAATPIPAPASAIAPPPLPRRSGGRSRAVPESQGPSSCAATMEKADDIGHAASVPLPPSAPPSAPPTPRLVMEENPPVAAVPPTIESTKQTQQPASQSSSTPPPAIPHRAPTHKRHSSLLPERIPLPESRPGTPGNGPPSRSTSPTPGAGACKSGTLPGAPPPVPRRAAARGSRLVNAADLGGSHSRPNTPPVLGVSRVASPPPLAGVTEAAGSGSPPLSSGSKVAFPSASPDTSSPVPESRNSEEKPKGDAIETDTKNPPVDKVDHEPIMITVSGSQSSDGGEHWKDAVETIQPVAQNHQQSAMTTVEKVKGVQGVQEDKSSGDSAPRVEPSETRDAVDDKDVKQAGGQSVEVLTETEEPSKVHIEETVAAKDLHEEVPSKKEEKKEEESKDDENREVYVGEATWEERTWKEVVRLREDMFWARIGGSR